MKNSALEAEQRLEKLLEFQSLLAKVAREIGPGLELQSVLKVALRAMSSLIEFKGGTVCLVSDDQLYVAASDPPVSSEVADLRLPVGQGIAGTVAAIGKPIYSPNLDTDPLVDPKVRATGSNKHIKSYLAVPMICLGEVIGIMQVDSAHENAFDDDDVRMLEGLATQVAGAIERARQQEQAQRLEKLKDEFVSRASHELRTPLTISSGLITTILKHELDSGTRRDFLERVDAANQRLTYLIEELLTATSLEAGLRKPAHRPVYLRNMLQAVAAGSAQPDLVRVQDGEDISVLTDERLLKYATSLLVDNAVRYADGATIDLTKDANRVVIEIADQGPGIDEDLKDRMFESFTRGDQSQPGWGLGLYMAQTIVQKLNGEITFEPAPTGGTRFLVGLEVEQEQHSEEEAFVSANS